MSRRELASLVVTAAALLVGGSAAAGTSPRVTLSAFPTVHERAQVVTLQGFAEGAKVNGTVTIEAKACGETSFREAFQAHTDARGNWTMQIAPDDHDDAAGGVEGLEERSGRGAGPGLGSAQ